MSHHAIKQIKPLTFPWQTSDPFLFCVFHEDAYPAGNEQMGPAASLEGRNLGEDFEGKDGWRMYHGDTVPGFPRHPHRGFETVTVVRQGFIDHADSMGLSSRFGPGDVEWITAGQGVCHSEMMPLLDREKPNPLELFQIWLNLPKVDKLAEPHVQVMWADTIPRIKVADDAGRETEIVLVAGSLGNTKPPSPPPHSWASRPESDLAIWTLKIPPHGHFLLPKCQVGSNRTLYFYRGQSLQLDKTSVQSQNRIELRPDVDVQLENGSEETELLLLQAKPIQEPVAQAGPFVMNTKEEVQQAFADYRRTQFGGWTWPVDDPTFPRDESRFVRYGDGRIERKPK